MSCKLKLATHDYEHFALSDLIFVLNKIGGLYWQEVWVQIIIIILWSQNQQIYECRKFIFKGLNRVPKTRESTTEMALQADLNLVSSHLINNLFAAISGTNSMIHYKGLINVWADDNPNKD